MLTPNVKTMFHVKIDGQSLIVHKNNLLFWWYFPFVGTTKGYVWVNYNISLTWIKAIWGWFPLLTMIPVRESSEVVIIYPERICQILMGWTSICQLFWGSLGARVLTNSHVTSHPVKSLNLLSIIRPDGPATAGLCRSLSEGIPGGSFLRQERSIGETCGAKQCLTMKQKTTWSID